MKKIEETEEKKLRKESIIQKINQIEQDRKKYNNLIKT